MVCQCGHPKWQHKGRDGRGSCCGEQRVFFRPWDGPRKPTWHLLDEDQAVRYLSQFKPHKQERMLERGYNDDDCICPMYHEVDLGGVSVLDSDGREVRGEQKPRPKIIIP